VTTSASSNVCPLCGTAYQLGHLHGYGYCVRQRYFAPTQLTAEDVRRIVREELERPTPPAEVKP
jgi:hypothetical protein